MGQWNCLFSWALAHLLREQSGRTQEALLLLALLLERDPMVHEIHSKVEEREHCPAESLVSSIRAY